MTDRELEDRLRAWYGAEVGEHEPAPFDLRDSLAAIPVEAPAPLRPLARPRGITLLAAAALLLVGGALAAGSGLLRLPTVIPPTPSDALLATAGPSPSSTPPPSATPAPTANARPGGLIAFIRPVEKHSTCRLNQPTCPVSRVWIVGSDGIGAHELFPDGVGHQARLAWAPDGSRLFYIEDGNLYATDPSGGSPRLVDTGCEAPAPETPLSCQQDSQVAFSRDGRSIVFVRESTDADGYLGPTAIATMALEAGDVTVLNATSPIGGWRPGWSPDRAHILFSRYGSKDVGGPFEPIMDALFVIDADGQNLHQVSPPTLDAIDGDWSPDGARIVFVSRNPDDPESSLGFAFGDLYTMRPDGSDVQQLTTEGLATAPSWTADGRILYTRGSRDADSGDAGWWTRDADGSNAALLMSATAIGVAVDGLGDTHPAWQPVGGAAIVPPPWTPAAAIAVGPPAPTPSPTSTPDLAPGFSWVGDSRTTAEDEPLGETATKLADGRVLITEGCGTAAELYDSATGSFSPTGSLLATRGGKTATLLADGRVLVTGGYNCARAGEDGVWATAEIYDPVTATFSATGSMSTPREFHTATLLADGRVLVAGGYTAPAPAAAGRITLASLRTAESAASVLATAEIYDPATGTFSKTGSMSTYRDHHTATLLEDGRVLVVGGGGEGYASSKSADVYDPAMGRFTKTGSLKTGRWLHTATLLGDGRVLILGGRSPQDSVYDSAETYDPEAGRFNPAGSMSEGRQQHTATLLPDGRVLIAGGYSSDGNRWRVLSSTEMFDPATDGYSPIGSMGTPRSDHTATRLDDGTVLIVGGIDIGRDGGVGVSSAVLFRP
jgi:Galactose oxidase, central domain/WD40-like Beta Propeller Repeat